MNKVVVFLNHTAKVLWNPENIDQYKYLPNVLVNPDTSKVDSIPQEYWKQSGSAIVPMTGHEIIERGKLIDRDPIGKPVKEKLKHSFHKRSKTWLVIGMFIGAMIGYLLEVYLHGRN